MQFPEGHVYSRRREPYATSHYRHTPQAQHVPSHFAGYDYQERGNMHPHHNPYPQMLPNPNYQEQYGHVRMSGNQPHHAMHNPVLSSHQSFYESDPSPASTHPHNRTAPMMDFHQQSTADNRRAPNHAQMGGSSYGIYACTQPNSPRITQTTNSTQNRRTTTVDQKSTPSRTGTAPEIQGYNTRRCNHGFEPLPTEGSQSQGRSNTSEGTFISSYQFGASQQKSTSSPSPTAHCDDPINTQTRGPAAPVGLLFQHAHYGFDISVKRTNRLVELYSPVSNSTGSFQSVEKMEAADEGKTEPTPSVDFTKEYLPSDSRLMKSSVGITIPNVRRAPQQQKPVIPSSSSAPEHTSLFAAFISRNPEETNLTPEKAVDTDEIDYKSAPFHQFSPKLHSVGQIPNLFHYEPSEQITFSERGSVFGNVNLSQSGISSYNHSTPSRQTFPIHKPAFRQTDNHISTPTRHVTHSQTYYEPLTPCSKSNTRNSAGYHFGAGHASTPDKLSEDIAGMNIDHVLQYTPSSILLTPNQAKIDSQGAKGVHTKSPNDSTLFVPATNTSLSVTTRVLFPCAHEENLVINEGCAPVEDQLIENSINGAQRMETTPDSAIEKTSRKQLLQKFQPCEKETFGAFRDRISKAFPTIPTHFLSKIFLDLASVAKRENLLSDARHLFQLSIQSDPTSHQGWLEWSKMEEECGYYDKCEDLLLQGLEHTDYYETLIIKYIKIQERNKNIDKARRGIWLAINRSEVKNKLVKVALEGAWMEARIGNESQARDIFQYLLGKVDSSGHLLYDASKFEERCGNFSLAYEISMKGIEKIPRHRPMWFQALRLSERMVREGSIPLEAMKNLVDNSIQYLSKDSVWKVHFEYSLALERLLLRGHIITLADVRTALVEALRFCPTNQRWKVWFEGARIECGFGSIDVSIALANKAIYDVPLKKKIKSLVMVGLARIMEFSMNIDKACAVLHETQTQFNHEWKISHEIVMFEIRRSNIKSAIERARESLKIYPGTGRLWAALIQLMANTGEDAQLQTFYEAVRETPKSGEVWCEGARIAMNPLSKYFNLRLARKLLNYAISFTPQYGDSFVEYIRLEFLTMGMNCSTSHIDQLCVNADPNYGTMWFYCKNSAIDTTKEILECAKGHLLREITELHELYQLAVMQDADEADDFVPRSAQSMARIRSAASEQNMELWQFSTGLPSLNVKYRNTAQLCKDDRRKLIFESEADFP